MFKGLRFCALVGMVVGSSALAAGPPCPGTSAPAAQPPAPVAQACAAATGAQLLVSAAGDLFLPTVESRHAVEHSPTAGIVQGVRQLLSVSVSH